MMKTVFAILCLSVVGLSQSLINNDTNQTAAYLNDTVLTPTNVQSMSFELLGSYTVDAPVYAEPLCVLNVTVAGQSRDLLIVVTLNDSIYAFDADHVNTIVWSRTSFATPYSSYPQSGSLFYNAAVGCVSTPVVDTVGGYVWAVCGNATPNWQLWQFNLATGAIVSTTTITGQVTGTGDQGGAAPDPTSGPNLLFFPEYELQRTGLVIANGNVYIGFSARDDIRPWHGWLMAYSTTTHMQTAIWNSAPNTFGGGIWLSSGAPSVDGDGNIYVATGNDNDAYDGITNFENSIVKLSPTLSVLDWFTPSDYGTDDAGDLDVGAGRVLLIPGTHYAVVGAKNFYVYVVDTTCMGHLEGSSMTCVLQKFQTVSGTMPNSESGARGMVYANSTLYVPTTIGGLFAYAWGGTSFNTTPTWSSTSTGFSFPGPAALSESCNMTSNCILWFTSVTSNAGESAQAGTLNAWNPSSGASYGSWALGANLSKYAPPSIIGGRVYVPTQSKVEVYGLAPAAFTGRAGQVGGQIQVGQ